MKKSEDILSDLDRVSEEVEQALKKKEKLLPQGVELPPLEKWQFAILFQIGQIINTIEDLDHLLEKIMDLCITAVDAERGIIILVDREGKLTVKTARNMDEETIKDVTQISKSIIRDVALKDKPIIVSEAMSDPRFKDRKSVILHKIKSLLCVPLFVRNKIIGTIYMDSLKASNLFSEKDLNFMGAFANQAATAIENAYTREYLLEERRRLKNEIERRYRFGNIIGTSVEMQKVYDILKSVINTSATVFLEGETGTGKELVAKSIHYEGDRKNREFVAISCGALPENLLESELFGYVKGAFTGAVKDKKGLFEIADGGTLFLDDISDLTPSIQAKLLRVLEEKELRRLGGTETIKIDVRIIAAINRELRKEVAEGKLREDLYYRLNVVHIKLPPLRKRKEDISLLAQHFLQVYSQKLNKSIKGFDRETMDLLISFDWPGNVRELENAVERACVLCQEEQIGVNDISIEAPTMKPPAEEMSEEKKMILNILKRTGGNKTKAAKLIGWNRKKLYRRMKALGINQ